MAVLEYEPGEDARVPQKVYSLSRASELGSLDKLRTCGVTHVAICKQAGSYVKDGAKPRPGGKGDAKERERREFYTQVMEEGELLKHYQCGYCGYKAKKTVTLRMSQKFEESSAATA